MKSKYLYFGATLAVAVSLLFSACDKVAKDESCNGIACAQALPIILLHFVDNQGRDLFNPATPNHLDSAKVALLNNNTVQVLPNGLTTPYPGHRKVIISWNAGENVVFYLKLSDTDQDTISYSQVVNKGCCASYQLKTFSYNGKAFTDSVTRHFFTVVK